MVAVMHKKTLESRGASSFNTSAQEADTNWEQIGLARDDRSRIFALSASISVN